MDKIKVKDGELLESKALGKTKIDKEYGKNELIRVEKALEESRQELAFQKSLVLNSDANKKKIAFLSNAIYIGELYVKSLKKKWKL